MALIKKYKIIILIIIFLNLLVISKTTLATTPDEITRKMTVGGSEIHQFEGAGNIILGALKVVGTICSVGMLMVIGIKYMMGSVEEKAEYELNTMLVSLIQDTMESSTIVKMSNKQQVDNCMDNLIPDLEDVGTKYGFK